jgi:diguanylate cyclase (GGDEF)-like protein
LASPTAHRLLVLVPLLVVAFVGVRSQQELHRRVEQLELVHSTVQILNDSMELETALELLAEQTKATLAAEWVLVTIGDSLGSERQVLVDDKGTRWDAVPPGLTSALRSATTAGGGIALIDSSANLFAAVFGAGSPVVPSAALLADLAVEGEVLGVLVAVQGTGVSPAGRAELELLRSLALHAAVRMRVRYLAYDFAKLRRRATHDAMLGLPTLLAVDDRLDAEVGPQAMVLVSLMNVEYATDLHGLDAGDQLLSAAIRRLRNLVRPEDLVTTAGKDEFAILICGATDPFAVEAFGERVLQQFAVPFRLEGTNHVFNVAARVGIGFGDAGHTDAASLLRQARERMRHRRLRQHLGPPES